MADTALTAAPAGATSGRGPIRAALVDLAPFAIGLVPFAIAIGVETAAAGLSIRVGLAGAALILAGAAQLAVIELVDAGAGPVVIAVTVVMINLRFVLYSAGTALWFGHEPMRRRLLMAIGVVDQTFLLIEKTFSAEPGLTPEWRRSYYGTVVCCLALVFLTCQPVGHAVGGRLPAESTLSLAGPLAFTAMLASAIRGRRAGVVAVVSAAAIVVLVAAPAGVGLPLAVLTGISVGSLVRLP